MSDEGSKPDPLFTVSGTRLLAALDAANTAASRATAEQRAASSEMAHQQSELEAVQESAQKLATRSRDIRNSLLLLRESLDRAKLSALNAGLEGARLGEPIGKALVVMSDEQRNLLARALDAMDEHSALLAEVDRDRDRCSGELSQLSERTRQAAAALTRAGGQSQLTCALLHEVRRDVGQLFGMDPEAEQAIAEARAHVRSAAQSLFELTQRAPLGAAALRELLSPLLTLIPSEDPGR